MAGCAKGPNLKTNPVGAVAYHADQVTQIMGKVETLIMTAGDAKVIPVSEATAALGVCRQIDVKAVELADLLDQLNKIPIDPIARAHGVEAVRLILQEMANLIASIAVPVSAQHLRDQIALYWPELNKILLAVAQAIH
jgi:hypothetical protein